MISTRRLFTVLFAPVLDAVVFRGIEIAPSLDILIATSTCHKTGGCEKCQYNASGSFQIGSPYTPTPCLPVRCT